MQVISRNEAPKCKCGNATRKKNPKRSITTKDIICNKCYKQETNPTKHGKKKKSKSKLPSLNPYKEIAHTFADENRRKSTPAAKHFKKLLDKLKVRVQPEKIIYKEVSFYLIDFFLPDKNLCIELDGGYHNTPEQKEKDLKRDFYLFERGYQSWRMTNEEALALTKDELQAKIDSYPNVERKVRVIPMKEYTPFIPKSKYLKGNPKPRRVKHSKPIKTSFPKLDELAANKARRDGMLQNRKSSNLFLVNYVTRGMITIEKKEFKQLYDIACEDWKSKFNDILKNYLFSDTLEFEEKFVLKMKDACSAKQKPVFDKLFKSYLKVDLIERVKSYKDVCYELGVKEPTLSDFSLLPEEQQAPTLAYHKIQNISKLFNQGWTPDWSDSNQCKYFPYFNKTSSGWVVRSYGYCIDGSAVGSGAYFKSSELALHCGNLFLDIYSDYLG